MRADLQTRPLSELVIQRTEKAVGSKDGSLPYVGLEHMESDSPDLLGVAHSSSSVSINSVFGKNDVLFGKLRPNLRKSVLAPFPGYCSTDILVLRPNDITVSQYAARIFQSDQVFRQAVVMAIGTKMPRTSWSALRQIKVFCPHLSEQRRIAEVLDTLDEAIRKTRQVVAKLQQIKQGLLHDLLTRGIDDNDELRDPERPPEQFKDSPLGRISSGWGMRNVAPPSSWKRTSLGSIAQYINGYAFKPEDWREYGTPIIRIAQMNDPDADFDSYPGVIPPQYRIDDGDLLFSWSATLMTLIWDRGPAYLNQHIFKVVPKIETDRDYLHHLLDYSMDALAGQTHGTTMKHIKRSDLLPLAVALPPLPEQRRIAEILDNLDSRITNERREAAKFRAFKHGLMDDLLTGQVHVSMGRAE